MICPDCGHDNIPGADACEDCGQDLTALDTPGSRSELEETIMGKPVGYLGPKPPVLIPPEATVGEAIATLCERRIGAVLVGTPTNLQGIFSERDVLMRVADRYDEVENEPIVEFMTSDVETLDIEAPIAFALNKMEVGDFRHLPVTRDGIVEGVISLRDVVGFLSDCYPELIPARKP